MLSFDFNSLHEPNISALRINTLAKLRNALTYLEIGVREGETFFNIDIENKFAVDPQFCFNHHLYQDNKNLHFFQTTSDAFFNLMSRAKSKSILFDIIFIDGMHTFTQSLTDFENSLRFSHDKTVWILDDTVPTNPYSWFNDRGVTNRLLDRLGYVNRPWHGDVFKTVFALHDMFKDFGYCTLLWKSQTIIWKLRRSSTRPNLFGSLADIDKFTFFDMLQNGKIFNLIPEHALLSILGEDPSQICYPDDIGEQLVYRMSKNDFK